MPWENIGECGGGSTREWAAGTVEIVIHYIELVCGSPPPGCELGVMWHEHECGDYPTAGLCWDPCVRSDPPWEYISRCEKALEIFDESVEWSEINPDRVREKLEANEGNTHLAQKPLPPGPRNPLS